MLISLDFVHSVHKSQALCEPEDSVSNGQRLSIARQNMAGVVADIDLSDRLANASRHLVGIIVDNPIPTFGATVTPFRQMPEASTSKPPRRCWRAAAPEWRFDVAVLHSDEAFGLTSA